MLNFQKYRFAPLALAVTGVVAGCSLSTTPTPDGRKGNLGKGVFNYRCLDGTNDDVACRGLAGGTSPTKFPDSVAVGGRFRVTFTPSSDTQSAGNPTLRGVSTEYLASDSNGEFHALKAGYVGIVAKSTVNSDVIDYTLMRIVDVKSLQLTLPADPFPDAGTGDAGDASAVPDAGASAFVLVVGGTQTITASPAGPRNEKLAGTLDYAWTTSDPSVLSLQGTNPTSSMAILGKAAGRATLKVTSDNMEASYEVAVR